MPGRHAFAALLLVFSVVGCTSDPSAPVNQMFPVRQMDRFFNSLSGPSLPPDDTREPGYAPAYPPIQVNGPEARDNCEMCQSTFVPTASRLSAWPLSRGSTANGGDDQWLHRAIKFTFSRSFALAATLPNGVNVRGEGLTDRFGFVTREPAWMGGNVQSVASLV